MAGGHDKDQSTKIKADTNYTDFHEFNWQKRKRMVNRMFSERRLSHEPLFPIPSAKLSQLYVN
jgi:hypothetical protein